VVATAVLAAFGGQAAAGRGSTTLIHCGDTVTASMTIANDLSGCTGVALTIAGPNVVVNFNNHTITSANGTTGVEVSTSATGATLLNGNVSGFVTGIDVVAGTVSVSGFGLFENGTGINVSGALNVQLVRNRLEGDSTGISLTGFAGTPPMVAQIKQNTITRGGFGILAANSRRDQIVANTVSQNSGDGINVFTSPDGLIADNDVSGNAGRGIVVGDSDATNLIDNTSSRNGRDGVFIKDSFIDVIDNRIDANSGDGINYSENSFERAAATRFGFNHVMRNAGIGVFVPVLTTDLGGNQVKNNAAGDLVTY